MRIDNNFKRTLKQETAKIKQRQYASLKNSQILKPSGPSALKFYEYFTP